MDMNREWYRSEFFEHEPMWGHREIEQELDFYSAIAKGNMEVVKKNLENKVFLNPQGMGVLSEDKVRNIRYHYVVSVALITRYCVYEGLEQEKAYDISDRYIMKMDKCKTIEEISKLHDLMCEDFCNIMIAIRKNQILSKQIVQCIEYIYRNLKQRVTLKEAADYLDISESYLSRLFKKEMGVSFSSYVLSLKVEEARHLLEYSDYPINVISEYLGFANESHFVQVFQKYVSLTPSKYRKKYFRSEWKLKK